MLDPLGSFLPMPSQIPRWRSQLLTLRALAEQAGDGQGEESVDAHTPTADEAVEEFVFLPSGNGYVIKGFGESGHLGKYIGLAVIARLIRTPNEPVSMFELVGANNQIVADRRSQQPALDEEAMSQIKERLRELNADLAQARAENNTVEADLAEKEIDEVTEQLAQTAGLSGKCRDLNNRFNKLRARIFGRLSTVYAALKNADPPMESLASHFEQNISSQGRAFIYRPPNPPPPWHFGRK
jgi:hypothetical protein